MRISLLTWGAAGAALLGLATPALAQADLAKKYNCTSCHAADKKMMGPSFKDIAAKYKGNKEAPDLLASKIRKGGSGNWGKVPMPPNPRVTDPDLKSLVNWILATK